MGGFLPLPGRQPRQQTESPLDTLKRHMGLNESPRFLPPAMGGAAASSTGEELRQRFMQKLAQRQPAIPPGAPMRAPQPGGLPMPPSSREVARQQDLANRVAGARYVMERQGEVPGGIVQPNVAGAPTVTPGAVARQSVGQRTVAAPPGFLEALAQKAGGGVRQHYGQMFEPDEHGMVGGDVAMGPLGLFGKGAKAAKGAKVAAEAVDPDLYLNFIGKKFQSLSPEEIENLRVLTRKAIAEQGTRVPKETVTFAQLNAEVEALHSGLKGKALPKSPAESMPRVVREAALDRLAALNENIVEGTKRVRELRAAGTDSKQLSAMEEQTARWTQDSKGIIAETSAVRSEDGRNLAFWARTVRKASFDTAYWLEEAARRHGGALPVDEEMALRALLVKGQKAVASGDTAALNETSEALAKRAQKWDQTPPLESLTTLRKAGLFRIRTHGRNIGSNVLWAAGTELASRPVSAVADMAMSLATGRRTMMLPRWRDIKSAGIYAATEGVKQASQIWKHGQSLDELRKLDLPHEFNSTLFRYLAGFGEIGEAGAKLDQAATWLARKSFRLLSAEDRPFRAFGYMRSLQGQARRMADVEVKSGRLAREDVEQYVRNLVDHPRKDMQADALYDSAYAVFSNPTWLGEKARGFRLDRMPRDLPAGQVPGWRRAEVMGRAVFEWQVPFSQTPGAVTSRVFQSVLTDPIKAVGMPIAATARKLAGAQAVSKGVPSARAQAWVNEALTADQQKIIAEAWGRGSLGVGTFLLGYWAAMKGLATGVREDDAGLRATDDAARRLPGSVRIGEGWHQVSGFAPVGQMFTLGASVAQEELNRLAAGERQDPMLERAMTGVGLAGRTALEQPFLSGTRESLETILNPTRRATGFARQAISSLVPGPLADVAEAADPWRRNVYEHGVLGGAMERIPGLRQQLPRRADVLGDRQGQGISSTFSPTIGSPALELTDPVRRELAEKRVPVVPIFRARADESNDELQARRRVTGKLVSKVVETVIRDPDYWTDRTTQKPRSVYWQHEQLKAAISRARNELARPTLPTGDGDTKRFLFSQMPPAQRVQWLLHWDSDLLALGALAERTRRRLE